MKRESFSSDDKIVVSREISEQRTDQRNLTTHLALATRNLSIEYSGSPALHDVTLNIEHNEITALIGPSGCGKTSFLSSLNRMTDLIAGCEVSGHIYRNGIDVHAPGTDVQQLRRQVGMIFQKPNPFPLSIHRNVDMPLKEHGFKNAAQRNERIEHALTEVGLWNEVKDRLDQSALTLSGGQQQRLCIARALALQPSVLLMDEPCSALDPISSAVVEDLIVRLKEKYTVVVVTHNLGQAKRIADSVALFWFQDGSGQLIEHRPTTTMFHAPSNELTKAYISGARG